MESTVSKSLVFKKILFIIISVVSLLLMAISFFYSARPEWFTWLDGFMGVDQATWGAVFATFGFGGVAGTLGFSVIKGSLSQALLANKSLSAETIAMVEEKTSKIIEEASTKYEGLLVEYSKQNDTIARLVLSVREHKEAFDELAKLVQQLNDLEVISLNKVLDNPLVNEETKAKIKQGLVDAGITPVEENPDKVD